MIHYKNSTITLSLMLFISVSEATPLTTAKAKPQSSENTVDSLVASLENGLISDFLDTGKIYPDAVSLWSLAILVALKKNPFEPFDATIFDNLDIKIIEKQLKQLKYTLKKRIKLCERQLKKQYIFNYKFLFGSIICAISSAVFLYSGFCDCVNHYQTDRQYDDLLNVLKQNGLKIIDKYEDLPDSVRIRYWYYDIGSSFRNVYPVQYFICPNTSLNQERMNQLSLLKTKKDAFEFEGIRLKLGCGIPLLMLADYCFKEAKKPHYDSDNRLKRYKILLDKYTKLLSFIDTILLNKNNLCKTY